MDDLEVLDKIQDKEYKMKKQPLFSHDSLEHSVVADCLSGCLSDCLSYCLFAHFRLTVCLHSLNHVNHERILATDTTVCAIKQLEKKRSPDTTISSSVNVGTKHGFGSNRSRTNRKRRTSL